MLTKLPSGIVVWLCCNLCLLYATICRSVEPEIYPRPDGTVYVCGEPEAVAVPASPADVNVVPELSANIQAVVGSLSSALRDAPVEAQQACYLPLSSDGLPVIGRWVKVSTSNWQYVAY